MEEIRKVAVACVGRAVFFGALAIGCVMVAFSFNPVSALQSGATLTLLMSGILIFKATAASSQNHKLTEVWLYLDEKHRPAEQHAKLIVGNVMREVYARFAQISLAVACGFFALSWCLMLMGLEPLHQLDQSF